MTFSTGAVVVRVVDYAESDRVVTLLDISKAQGNHLLDRLEELLRERATPKAIIRKKKPTFARPAPDALRKEIVGATDVVVEGLAD